MKREDIDKYRVVQYDDHYDVLETPVARINAGKYQKYLSMSNPWTWYGCGSSVEVMRYVEHGWPEGLDKMIEKSESMSPPPRELPRPRIVRGEWGEAIDMAEVWAGNLDTAWTRSEHTMSMEQQRYTVAVDMGALGSVTADELFWPGAAMYTVAKGLIEAGRPVRIIGYACNPSVYYGVKEFFGCIQLKAHGQFLTPDVLALTALAGVYRTVGFKMYCNENLNAKSTMGRSRRVTDEEVRKYLDIHTNDYLINVPRARTKGDADEFITEIYEKLT